VSNTGAWSIVRSSTSGTNTTLAGGTRTALGTNTWHTLAMTLQGSTISRRDRRRHGRLGHDSAYQTGQIGLGVVGYQTTSSTTCRSRQAPAAPHHRSHHVGPGRQVRRQRQRHDHHGNKIDLWDCNTTSAQQWTVVNGALQNNGKCMDVTGQATTDGTLVELWDCNGAPNQQ